MEPQRSGSTWLHSSLLAHSTRVPFQHYVFWDRGRLCNSSGNEPMDDVMTIEHNDIIKIHSQSNWPWVQTKSMQSVEKPNVMEYHYYLAASKLFPTGCPPLPPATETIQICVPPFTDWSIQSRDNFTIWQSVWVDWCFDFLLQPRTEAQENVVLLVQHIKYEAWFLSSHNSRHCHFADLPSFLGGRGACPPAFSLLPEGSNGCQTTEMGWVALKLPLPINPKDALHLQIDILTAS